MRRVGQGLAAPSAACRCSDRPQCELLEGGTRSQDAGYAALGALVHCNLRLGGASLARLLRFVDAAVARWAAATGHFEVLSGALGVNGSSSAPGGALETPGLGA